VLSCSVWKMDFPDFFFSGPTLLTSTSGKKSHCRVPRVFENFSIFFYMLKFYRRFSRSYSELQADISQIRGDFQSLVLLLN